MRFLPPVIDYGPANPARDEASEDGYPLTSLEARLADINAQPNWRWRSDRACAFYDMGKQLTPERERKIRMEWGIEPRQTNLIFGVVNGVLGEEARGRTDIRIEADRDEDAELCDVFNPQMEEARRESNMDMAVSNAYASQVKAGIGWGEVSESSDPLDYWLRATDIHRNEIWYDWRAKDLGLSDAAWLIRKRWQDLDEAVAMMPEHRELLKQAVNGWDLLALPEEGGTSFGSSLVRGWNDQRRTTIMRDEWCDTTRRRIKFFEVWYRVPAEVVVMHLGPTRCVAFEPKNALHAEAVSRGLAKLSKRVTRQVRMALFAGPHRLLDVGTTRRRFPYIPFFAFRDDEDRSPYGLIEGMISPQEEYNERRQLFNWMLLARQLIMDADALEPKANTIEHIRRSLMRPDFMAVLNPNRKNANALRIGNDLAFQQEQFRAMQDAKALVQEVPRIYSTQLGDAPSGVTSGIAINSLTEQGTVAMGELNDNYRYARRAMHEEALDLIIKRHLEADLKVQLGVGKKARVVVLNTFNEAGEPVNMVKDAALRVALADVPSSPAFRMQQQQMLSQLIQGAGQTPQALAILSIAWVEGSSHPNRKVLADQLRKAYGIPDPDEQAEDGQAEQAAQAQQAAEQQAQQVQQALIENKIGRDQAAAERDASAARLNDAKAQQLGLPPPQDPAAAQDAEDAEIQAGLAAAMASPNSMPGPAPSTLQ